jgi:hypothetical protein
MCLVRRPLAAGGNAWEGVGVVGVKRGKQAPKLLKIYKNGAKSMVISTTYGLKNLRKRLISSKLQDILKRCFLRRI